MNAVVSALVNGAILSAGITVAVWVVLSLASRRVLNAATRYAVWWAALIATIALPAAYLPARPHGPEISRIQAPRREEHRVEAPASLAQARTSRPHQSAIPAMPRRPTAPLASTRPKRQVVHLLSFPLQIRAVGWPRWALGIWMGASLVLLIRLAVSCVMLERLRARASGVPPAVRARASEWLVRSGSRRVIRLAGSEEIPIPVAVGPRRPSILIPSVLFDELPEEEIEQLVLHEAAHLARRDDYALLAQRLCEALLPWHPVVWWISRRLQLEREIACDDRVIATTGRPRSYALCLTRVVEISGGRRSSWVAATAADGRSQLARRVDLLLEKTRRWDTRVLKGRLAGILALLAAAAWMSTKSPGLVAFATPLARSPLRVLIPQLPKVAFLPQASTPAPAQDVEGQVIEDSSGMPVASAELRFHEAGMRELAADLETDRQGRFSAEGLPAGAYTVDVSKPNYVTTSLKLSAPAAGQVVRLIRYGVIDGEVTDAAGRPLPGRILSGGRTVGSARITVLVKQPGTEALRSFRDTIPEDGGRYRIFDLPPGQYAVGLWYSGLEVGSGMQLYPDNANPRWFTVSGGEEYSEINFSVTPSPAYAVSGKIALPRPKTQFQVALGLPDQPTLPIAQALTEDDGSFHFAKVPTGAYDLFVAGPVGGYTAFDSILGRDEPLFGRERIQVGGQDVTGLAVPLTKGRTLRVVLRGPGSGAPPAGCSPTATVAFTSLEPWAILFQLSATASFANPSAIGPLAPGRFQVGATGLGTGCYQVNQPVADLSADAEDPVAVELASAGSIRGLLKAGTEPAAGFAVVLVDAESADGAQARLAVPDAQGHFAFDGLRPGRYRIAARPTQGAQARWINDASRMTEIEIAGGAPTSLELPVETGRGRP